MDTLVTRAQRAGYRLGLETAAVIASRDARECPDHPLHSDAHDWCWSALAIEAAIRCEIERSS